MKRHLLILFAALLPLLASAHDFEVDGIYYNITSNTEAEVTYKGDSFDGYYVYTGGYSDSTITIPATVTYEGVEYSVTRIGNHAFDHCWDLISITLPESVTSIGGDAFSDCRNLTAINIPEGVTSIEPSVFNNCESLIAINIPEGVTSIGEYAFCNCEDLTTINIPEGVTSIASYVFFRCFSLTAITLPEAVTSIGEYALYNCSSLTTITIPKGVTYIGTSVFRNCNRLTTITCKAETPPTIEYYTFDRIDKSIPLYVPAASVEAYKGTEHWSKFTNIMEISAEAGINAMSTAGGQQRAIIYDLTGRRVENATKPGIYIVNDKKVVIK